MRFCCVSSKSSLGSECRINKAKSKASFRLGSCRWWPCSTTLDGKLGHHQDFVNDAESLTKQLRLVIDRCMSTSAGHLKDEVCIQSLFK